MGKQKEPSLGKKGTSVSEKAEAKTCQKKPGSLCLLVSWAKHEIGKETGRERDRSKDDGVRVSGRKGWEPQKKRRGIKEDKRHLLMARVAAR